MMKLSGLGLNATSLMAHNRWEALPMAEAADLQGVELSAGRHAGAMVRAEDDRERIREIQARLVKHGLRAMALGLHRDLSDPEQLQEYLLLLEKAAALECPLVTTGVPDACREQDFASGLYRAAVRAQALGVTLCLENHGQRHGSGQSLLPLLDIHLALRLCYDTGNVLFYSDTTPEEDLPRCIHQVRHLHLKDKRGGKGLWCFPPPGEGEISFEKLLSLPGWTQPLSAVIEIEFTPEGVSLEETGRAVLAAAHHLRNLPPLCGDQS